MRIVLLTLAAVVTTVAPMVAYAAIILHNFGGQL